LSDLQQIHGILFNESAKRISLPHFCTEVADSNKYLQYKRNLYKSHSSCENSNNVSFVVNSNDGLSYFEGNNSNINNNEYKIKISNAFVRRVIAIRFQNKLGGIRFTEKNYYNDERGFKLYAIGTPQHDILKIGYTYFTLDLLQYLGMGSWGDNRYLRSCISNTRLAMVQQYLPIKILRKVVIFVDEIFPDDSLEMMNFLKKQHILERSGDLPILKEILLSTSEFKEIELNDNTVNIIANHLIEVFEIDLRKHPNTGDWLVYGVLFRNNCSNEEIEAFDNPSSKDYQLKDPLKPQQSLPRALQFFITNRIDEKFNRLVSNLYLSLKNDNSFNITATEKQNNDPSKFTIPRKDKNLFNTSTKKFLEKMKISNCCF
jgi:hypothetical protein